MQQLTKAEQLMEQLWTGESFYERFTSDFQTKPKRQRLPLY
jgi:hypothetical protein